MKANPDKCRFICSTDDICNKKHVTTYAKISQVLHLTQNLPLTLTSMIFLKR